MPYWQVNSETARMYGLSKRHTSRTVGFSRLQPLPNARWRALGELGGLASNNDHIPIPREFRPRPPESSQSQWFGAHETCEEPDEGMGIWSSRSQRSHVKNRWLIGGGYFLTSRNGLVVAPKPRFSFVKFGIDLYQTKGQQEEPVISESLYVTLYVAAYRGKPPQEREKPKMP